MTALMVIIIVLLIILVLWAAGVTVLYAQLVRTVKQITASDGQAMDTIFSSHKGLLELIQDTLDSLEAVEQLAVEYKQHVNDMVDRNAENTRFALDTIQQARRIYAQVNSMLAQPITANEEETATKEEEENNG